MDLKQLKASGGLVSTKPQKVTKEWETPDGVKLSIDFFVVRQSFGSAERFFLGTEEDKSKSRTSQLLADVIRLGKDGKERLSYEDAFSLEPSLASVFLDAVSEIQTAKKAVASSTETSGTSSSSPESAA